jgi:hypothetical protein
MARSKQILRGAVTSDKIAIFFVVKIRPDIAAATFSRSVGLEYSIAEPEEAIQHSHRLLYPDLIATIMAHWVWLCLQVSKLN